MGRLKNKIAVVTGSANGIGLGMARLFAAEGAHVYVTDLDGAAVEAAVAGIKAQGFAASGLVVDVTKGQDVGTLVRTLQSAHGRIDVLVNYAGINVRNDLRNTSDADWVKIREVNLDAVVRIARDAFPLLKASDRASMINLASIMGNRGFRPLAAYSATKGAVSALTRGLAIEYAPFNIRVNGLAPGFIETQLIDRLLKMPPINKAILDKTPLRRFGTPEDVANAALFLASDESAFITGVEIPVDGGMAAAL